MDRKSGYIMLSVAAGALLAGVIDAVVRPGYLVKIGRASCRERV